MTINTYSDNATIIRQILNGVNEDSADLGFKAYPDRDRLVALSNRSSRIRKRLGEVRQLLVDLEAKELR